MVALASASVRSAGPRAYLLTIVSRLCLNELGSARARKETLRGDYLPEPVFLSAHGLAQLEAAESVSMAFLVLLERLSPAERAVLLLHEVFEFSHAEVAELLGRTPSATRKLLERARQHVRQNRPPAPPSTEQHRALLQRFLAATSSGDLDSLLELLAGDASLVTDGGSAGRDVAGIKNLREPLVGAERVARFLLATAGRVELEIAERTLNGQPAAVFYLKGRRTAPFAALLLDVTDQRIQQVFFHADQGRLSHL